MEKTEIHITIVYGRKMANRSVSRSMLISDLVRALKEKFHAKNEDCDLKKEGTYILHPNFSLKAHCITDGEVL